MAIAKRPSSNQVDIDSFISGGTVRALQPQPVKDAKRVATIVRFPPDMLRRVDAAAKRRGVSRAAWLLMVASKALDAGE